MQRRRDDGQSLDAGASSYGFKARRFKAAAATTAAAAAVQDGVIGWVSEPARDAGYSEK